MGNRVLIIHENAEIRILIKEMFEDTGSLVTVVEEVAKGLVVAASEPFDLIIVDRAIVCAEGESLSDWLKKSGVGAPIITAASEDAERWAALAAEIDRVAAQGWALVDGELEEGLRSIAAPVRGPTGRVVAAVNVSMIRRGDPVDQCEQTLPALHRATRAIESDLSSR